MDNGLPVTPAASVTRNLLRVADFLPFGYGFAAISMLLRRDCKRLSDVAAATLVVHVPRSVPRTVASNVPPSPGGRCCRKTRLRSSPRRACPDPDPRAAR